MNKLLTLLHLCDSSYPTGAFAHSWGLEAAISRQWVKDVYSLMIWGRESIQYSLIPLDIRAIEKAYDRGLKQDLEGILDLDRELALFRPSRAMREAQAQVGRSFIEITSQVYGKELMLRLDREVKHSSSRECIQFPVAWGVSCAELEIPLESAGMTYLLSSVKQMANVAVRLIPIGQKDANHFIAKLSGELDEVIRRVPVRKMMSIGPGLDIAGMLHDSLKARYFRS